MQPRLTETLVADLVREIPAGRATTYGSLAAGVARVTGRRYPPIAVGGVLRRSEGLPWWRVVDARGTLPAPLLAGAREHWTQEGTAVLDAQDGGPARVDLYACGWDVELDSRIAGEQGGEDA